MSLDRLTTEARNPASSEIDRLSSLDIVRLMNAEDAKIPPAIAAIEEPLAEAVDVITDRLRTGGRLIYIGAGTSGRLGVLDASECPPTFNTPPWQVVGVIAGGQTALTRAVEGAEDHPELAVHDLKQLNLSDKDVVVGIAASGRTPYVIGGLKYAATVGAVPIGLACNANSELTAVSKIMLAPVAGPEVVSGSTRLKSGTATKLVLNTLTTATMVRLGKTYGNLMVDLAASNIKLEDRARRIVSSLTGDTLERAGELLTLSHGDVKTAIVIGKRNVDEATARQLIAEAQGQLRGALENPLPTADRQVDSSSIGQDLVIGIDGGGSKTIAWLARLSDFTDTEADPQPIGIGEAGASNANSVGWAAATANLELAITRAFEAAGLPRETVAALCMGVAGAGRESDQERLKTWAERRRLADNVLVTHDVSPLLFAPGLDGNGIALVAGTGSLAYGLTPDGKSARAGGLGYLLGDEGSGYRIALEGMRAALKAMDGRSAETSLVAGFQEAFGVSSPAEFIQKFYPRAEDRMWVASFAHVVMKSATDGDDVAREIVQEAIDDLAMLIATVGVRLLGAAPSGFPLALAGGIVVNSEFLRNGILQRLKESGLSPSRVVVVSNPVTGPLRMAAIKAMSTR